MKLAKIAFILLSNVAILYGCQTAVHNDTVHADRETFRKEAMSYFDFEQEPMMSDVKLIVEPQFEKFKVTDNDLLLSLGSDRHYYKFYYYSRMDTAAGKSFLTMLGYYDTYYDLLLVSFEGHEVFDKVVIASFAGDTEDFDNVTGSVNGSGEWNLRHVVGKRFFENDSISIRSRVESRVVLDADGYFETTVVSNQAGDPEE